MKLRLLVAAESLAGSAAAYYSSAWTLHPLATVVELSVRLNAAEVGACGGIAMGEMIAFEADDYISTPVNPASRLSDAAKLGQVLTVLKSLLS